MSEQNNEKFNFELDNDGKETVDSVITNQIEEELKRSNHDMEGSNHEHLKTEMLEDQRKRCHTSHNEHHHHHHHHSHGHSSHKHKKSKKKKVLRVIIIILSIILAFVIALVGTFFVMRQLGKSDLLDATGTQISAMEKGLIEYKGHKYSYNNDVVSVAFIGVDKREISESVVGMAGQADADIVLTMNVKTGYSKAIAIPRDTMVDVNVYDPDGKFTKIQKMQLCLSYAYGDGKELSCQNTVTSISRVLKDIPIAKYFALDLNGISAMNDAIGGVTLKSLVNFEDIGIDGGVQKGETVTLKGIQSERYIRNRDGKDINGSVNRTNRQIQYIKTYVSQILPSVKKDFGVVSDLFSTAKEYGVTDLTMTNLTYLGSQFLTNGLGGLETETIQGTMKQGEDAKPGEGKSSYYAEFYPDEDKLMETVLSTFYNRIS